jgi:hypothetical protein
VVMKRSGAIETGGRGPRFVSADETPGQYELRVDGSWQPIVLEIRRAEAEPADTIERDDRVDALLSVNEFNIRQVEAACDRKDLELRDDHGGLWKFRPRRIKFESDAYAEGTLSRTDRYRQDE